MRRGEIVALRWRHVGLDRAQVSVEESAEQTKWRPVQVPQERKGTHRGSAEEHRRGAARTPQHASGSPSEARDPTIRGIFRGRPSRRQPLQPRSLTHAFEVFVATHNLPRVLLHDLRRSHATAMLKNKVHPKVVQERLGHSTIAITMDIYSHVLDGMQEDAVETVDAALQAALIKRREELGSNAVADGHFALGHWHEML